MNTDLMSGRGHPSPVTDRSTHAGRPLGVWLLSAGAVALLVLAGTRIPTPPLAIDEWPGWLDSYGPATAFMAGARLIALLGAAYVAAISLATAVARQLRWSRLNRLVDALTTPALKGALHGVVGLSLVVPFTPAGATPDDTATIRPLDPIEEVQPSIPSSSTSVPSSTTTTQPPSSRGDPMSSRGGSATLSPSPDLAETEEDVPPHETGGGGLPRTS